MADELRWLRWLEVSLTDGSASSDDRERRWWRCRPSCWRSSQGDMMFGADELGPYWVEL